MSFEKYKELIENNDELSNMHEIFSSLYAITDILIKNKMCKEKEFIKLKTRYKEEILEKIFEEYSKTEQSLKTLVDLIFSSGGRSE